MKKKASFHFPAWVCMAALLFATEASAQQLSEIVDTPRLVRITMLMLSMPEEKFLTLRPDLLDGRKIEKTIPVLLDGVKRKEITLEGFPMVVTKSGQRAVMETEREVRDDYPQPPPGYIPVAPTTPTTFETVSPGQILEVEPIIGPDGVHINLNIAPQHMELLGYRLFTLPQNKDIAGATGKEARLPIYFFMKATTSLSLVSCRHALIGVFKKEKPEGTIEIFIVGAEVLDIGN